MTTALIKSPQVKYPGLLKITERQWQNTVVAAAAQLGWTHYHTEMSRGSNKGFPDLVLVKPPRVLFVELKTGAYNTTRHQDAWLDLLRQCDGVETYLWRSSDEWDEIVRTLSATP